MLTLGIAQMSFLRPFGPILSSCIEFAFRVIGLLGNLR